jgi:hypothetical protein
MVDLDKSGKITYWIKECDSRDFYKLFVELHIALSLSECTLQVRVLQSQAAVKKKITIHAHTLLGSLSPLVSVSQMNCRLHLLLTVRAPAFVSYR